MQNIGFIPLRAGSKSIKNKNKKKLLGRPLFSWVLNEAIKSNLSQVYVFTDDHSIISFIEKEYAKMNKVKVLKRSEESATDYASTELAMKEFATLIGHEFDVLCLIQATSPLLDSEDINRILRKINEENYDSALSVVEYCRFIWSKEGKPINYAYENRPRRQDFEGLLVENGAVYGIKKSAYLKCGYRIGGKIGLVKMKLDSLIEIDEIEDWIIIEQLLKKKLSTHKKAGTRIKALFLDVDGVFTRGSVFYNEAGEYLKEYSLRDGMGLELLRDSGVEVYVITSENSQIVARRMEKLNITNYYLGVRDKLFLFEEILKENNFKKEETAYIGDDINDLALVLSSGWSFCPSDAMQVIKNSADVVLRNNGGYDAIREAVEFIMRLNERSLNNAK